MTVPSAVMCTDVILAVGCLRDIITKVLAIGFCSIFLATTAVFSVSQKPTVHKLDFIAIGNSAVVRIKELNDEMTQKYSFVWVVTFQKYRKDTSSLLRWGLEVLFKNHMTLFSTLCREHERPCLC